MATGYFIQSVNSMMRSLNISGMDYFFSDADTADDADLLFSSDKLTNLKPHKLINSKT